MNTNRASFEGETKRVLSPRNAEDVRLATETKD
jgi:hypothetical protein